MSTVWFNLAPGQTVAQEKTEGDGAGDGTAVVIFGPPGTPVVPDWLRLPPELGGHQVRVTGHESRSCPRCGQHDTTVLALDDPTHLRVASCRGEWIFFRYRSSQ